MRITLHFLVMSIAFVFSFGAKGFGWAQGQTQGAWDDYATAFREGDMASMLQHYTDTSVVQFYNVHNCEWVSSTGRAQISKFFTNFFQGADPSLFSDFTTDVETNMVFQLSSSPEQQYHQAVETYQFDEGQPDLIKVLNVVVNHTSATAPDGCASRPERRELVAPGALQADESHRGNYRARNLTAIVHDYTPYSQYRDYDFDCGFTPVSYHLYEGYDVREYFDNSFNAPKSNDRFESFTPVTMFLDRNVFIVTQGPPFGVLTRLYDENYLITYQNDVVFRNDKC